MYRNKALRAAGAASLNDLYLVLSIVVTGNPTFQFVRASFRWDGKLRAASSLEASNSTLFITANVNGLSTAATQPFCYINF